MSKVPTCILASDGELYRNPIIRGDDWFICFDDDDPPELVLFNPTADWHADTMRAQKLITGAGLDAAISNTGAIAGRRVLHKTPNGKAIASARSFWLRINSPPNPSLFGPGVKPIQGTPGPCAIEKCGGSLRKLSKRWRKIGQMEEAAETQRSADQLRAEVQRLQAEVTRLRGFEQLRGDVERYRRMETQFRELISQSEGVVGLHRNGEIADWDWLINGSDWLETLR